MGPAWAQALLRGPCFLLVLCALVSSVCCSHGPPGWRFTSSEVVIPRKVHRRLSGAESPGQLSYSMRFQGRRHVIHMKVKKNLLPRHFPVVTDNDQGAMQKDYPFVPQDCYYLSYLEGVPGSMATLDTCRGGLRGMLQVDDLTYEIKPLEASFRFEHLVSLLVSDEKSAGVERCMNDGEDINLAVPGEKLAESPRALPTYLWVGHKKHLKLHYTVTHSLYNWDTNMTHILENIIIMNNIIHTIYAPAKVNVNVRLICIWNDNDHTDLTPNTVYRVMEIFGLWKHHNWWKEIPHDTSLLLTGHRAGGGDYGGFQNGVCNPNWGVAYVHVTNYHWFKASSMAAHAVGHNFNFQHDSEGCHCFRRTKCVMNEEPGLFDSLSNCSYAVLFRWTAYWDPCLSYTQTPYGNFPYVASRCGDKTLDNGEECDCGSFKECFQDKCCETNCAMTLGSLCTDGDCCINCKYAPPGWVCREILGICDLPEYCDGKTHHCPKDAYIQDGTPCSAVSVCVAGNCSDRELQCQALFGYHAKDASPACYEKLNVIGDRFGNCGVRPIAGGRVAVGCASEDVFCGSLHCKGVTKVPGGGEHSTFHNLVVYNIKEERCSGYDVHFGTEKPYMGLVVDGATCGPGSYCLRQNCTYYHDLNFSCNVSTCNYKGVCNNNRNCHCQRGYKPPFCAEKGAGGSVDSGPPPDKDRALRARIFVNVNKFHFLTLIRLILFLCALLIGFFSRLRKVLKSKEDENKKDPEKDPKKQAEKDPKKEPKK